MVIPRSSSDDFSGSNSHVLPDGSHFPDYLQGSETQYVLDLPPNEACSPKSLTERIKATAETFLVAEDKETGKLAAFLNGVPTDEEAFRDEFFTDISLSNPEGKNIMLLGLDVRPEYRMQGLGRELVSRYCQKEAQKGRKKLFLTCLDEKVKMYEKFGFTDLGQANSTWGGEAWHAMSIEIGR